MQGLSIERLEEFVKQGYPDAINELAIRYDDATGVPRDRERAYKLYLLAAEAGYSVSQYNLGCMWESGQVPSEEKNYEVAKMWFKKSALQGDKDAQYRLGYMYENTYNDKENAFHWYVKAASQNQEQAINRLIYNQIHNYRDGYNYMILQNSIINEKDEKISDLNDKITGLEQKIEKMERYITELECMPPDKGGVLYQYHKTLYEESQV